MNYSSLFIEQKLPDVLSDEEVYDCFKKMKNGDIEAREKIIIHNIRIVIYIASKFKYASYDMKELISTGFIGLIKSVDTFNISEGIKFSTYSARCITNEILMFMRKEKKYVNDKSLNEPVRVDDDESEINYLDCFIDNSVDIILDYEKKESYEIIRKIINELQGIEKIIILKHFGFYENRRMTQSEIAKEIGVSQSYVSRILKNVLIKISVELKELGIMEPSFSLSKKSHKRGCTLYDYFSEYTKEQIDIMLSKLTDEDRKLIFLRFGSDLNNPVRSNEWDKTLANQYYNRLIPKMKKILKKPDFVFENVSPELENKKEINHSDELEIISKTDNVEGFESTNMTKEDFSAITRLLKDTTFGQMLDILTLKEAIIFSLKFGYVNDKCFTVDEIAKFMGMELDEVDYIVNEAKAKVSRSAIDHEKVKSLLLENNFTKLSIL